MFRRSPPAPEYNRRYPSTGRSRSPLARPHPTGPHGNVMRSGPSPQSHSIPPPVRYERPRQSPQQSPSSYNRHRFSSNPPYNQHRRSSGPMAPPPPPSSYRHSSGHRNPPLGNNSSMSSSPAAGFGSSGGGRNSLAETYSRRSGGASSNNTSLRSPQKPSSSVIDYGHRSGELGFIFLPCLGTQNFPR